VFVGKIFLFANLMIFSLSVATGKAQEGFA